MSKKFHVVYMTTNPENGKFYIGKHSTDDLEDGYQGSGRWVDESVKLGHPIETHRICKLNSEEEAYKLEYELIQSFMLDCPDLCMNMAPGGSGCWAGFSQSEESKRKKSLKLSGRKLTKEHSKKISESLKGKRHTGKALENVKRNLSLGSRSRAKWIVCLKTGMTFRDSGECARFWGTSRTTVLDICNGKFKSKRFEFEYMDK